MKSVTEAPQLEGSVAVIVGGGPGISSSCARLFSANGMRVAVAARTPDKAPMKLLEQELGVNCYACDAANPQDVARLFSAVTSDLGTPRLVVHNIDGRTLDIIRKDFVEAEAEAVRGVLMNSPFSAFLVAQQAVQAMLADPAGEGQPNGTIVFSNASAAIKGYPRSAAFAMACHAKAGLTESMARELMPHGIHVAHVPIDGAIGWVQEDGSRWHRLAGTTEQDNMLHPDYIAQTYLQIHTQHRSTWTNEVVLRPWVENW